LYKIEQQCRARVTFNGSDRVRTIGFHASKGIIRFVVLEGDVSSPTVVSHDRRPLQLVADRPTYIQNARNLFDNVLTSLSPDRLAYVLSMNAKSQEQIAGLVLPFAALNICAKEHGKDCYEFIAPNFGKTYFTKRNATWHGDRYDSATPIFGSHPPNWTKNEQLAALAAWGAM
jgi:hypothetical protein